MMACAIAGNISGEATGASGNTFVDAMRGTNDSFAASRLQFRCGQFQGPKGKLRLEREPAKGCQFGSGT